MLLQITYSSLKIENVITLDFAEGDALRTVIDSLTPATTYVVTVAGVNGATRDRGVGMASNPVRATTLCEL